MSDRYESKEVQWFQNHCPPSYQNWFVRMQRFRFPIVEYFVFLKRRYIFRSGYVDEWIIGIAIIYVTFH